VPVRLVTALVATAVAVLAAAAPATAGKRDTLGAQLAEVRAATAKYHRVEAAVDDGYVPFGPCVAVPGLGGMGYHFARLDLIDGTLSLAQPEILVYAPAQNGRLRLVAVEYVVPVAASPERPSLFGRGFDDAHDVGAPYGPQWDLHAWVWHHNPLGVFAPFNPNVGCG
jgi:hypothetical protein